MVVVVVVVSLRFESVESFSKLVHIILRTQLVVDLFLLQLVVAVSVIVIAIGRMTNQNCSSSLVLKATSQAEFQDPAALAIIATCQYAQIPLELVAQQEDDSTSHSAPLTLIYQDELKITSVHAALRFLMYLRPASLLPQQQMEFQIDAWLSYFHSNFEDHTTLEQQLQTQKYLTSNDALSVADIRCLSLFYHHQNQKQDDSPTLSIWIQDMMQQDWWQAALEAAQTGATTTSTNNNPSTTTGLQLNGTPTPVVSKMYRRQRIRMKELFQEAEHNADHNKYLHQSVTVAGWARSVRKQGAKLLFVTLNDGSSGHNLQCVLNDCQGFEQCTKSGGTGASFQFTGTIVPSQGQGQSMELQVTNATLLGAVYAGNREGTEVGGTFYPLARKEHTLEYLRDQAHLRARTQLHAAAMRIRHAMAFATHHFFHAHGFTYIHTPIVTGADCEGAGEQFAITTLLGSDHLATGVHELPVHGPPPELSKSEMKRLKKKEGKQDDPTKPKVEVIPGAVDYSQDFFGQRVNLTVSGQLNVETHACALSDVYTFGPTFRAEHSYTGRHLSEFWMIEPEIAFADLSMDIDLAEDYLKYCVQYALDNCNHDLEFFEKSSHGEEGLRDRLRNVLAQPFKRLKYTEAIEILQKAVADGHKFEEEPVWGMDLPSEHERYICEKVFKQPVVLMDYPKDIKAFYMKLNEDGKTVAAADILVPKIGEIIGGSEREYRLDVLQQRCEEMNLDPRQLWWYLDLRRYGSVPHAGFGLGFERLILFVTGLSNIRDVIPFPRWAGNAKF